jgi:acetyl esterase/lipase
MKASIVVLTLLLACGAARAEDAAWQPSPGHTQIPLWPGTPPDTHVKPGPEIAKTTDDAKRIGGRPYTYIRNVSAPTMTVYSPSGRNTGAAVVVIPGGGFEILAIDLEGTEICDWLTPNGITCVLLKYRVPSAPYDWHCDCRPHNLETSVESLDDAQRAIRLVRSRAAEWHVDPHKIGVIGFSAGGYLVAETSTRFARPTYARVDAADAASARPDFAMAIYPGHLATANGALNPNVPVSKDTPPTLLVQAGDDTVDGVKQSLVYYAALQKAGVPVEMHLFANGGHAFGLRKTAMPITGWPNLAETWMRAIGVVTDP